MRFLKPSSILWVLFSANVLSLEAILDEDMSGVTGQAGITIETSTSGSTSIGEIRYDDRGNDGLGGSLSIRNIVIDDISSTLVVDVLADELVFKLTEFATTDINIGAIQFGYESGILENDTLGVSSSAQIRNAYGSLGAIAINDYTLDPNSNISLKFNSKGQIALNSYTPFGSFFYFTYVDDGHFEFDTGGDGGAVQGGDEESYNYLHAKVSFTEFILEDITLESAEDDKGAHLLVSLSDVSGGITFENISINGNVAGTIGLENIDVNQVSYMKVRGY